MRQLRIETRARDDLTRIFRYIALRNPRAALRTLDRIDAAIDTLSTFSTGRAGRIPGTFEKVVTGLPYIVVYTLTRSGDRESVVIIMVHHTSRQLPGEE